MERDCESELSKLNIEQNACIYHFGASVIHGQRSNILRLQLFYMIKTSVDIKLLAYLYSSQLITKDKKSLSDHKRFYFTWITEIIQTALDNGEFKNTSTTEELVNIYAMYERAILYDWALFKGKFDLTDYSDKLLPHVLDTFVEGV